MGETFVFAPNQVFHSTRNLSSPAKLLFPKGESFVSQNKSFIACENCLFQCADALSPRGIPSTCHEKGFPHGEILCADRQETVDYRANLPGVQAWLKRSKSKQS